MPALTPLRKPPPLRLVAFQQAGLLLGRGAFPGSHGIVSARAGRYFGQPALVSRRWNSSARGDLRGRILTEQQVVMFTCA